METLYHVDIFIPDWFTIPTGTVALAYTRHALKAHENDRYGTIPLAEELDLSRFRLIELGVVDGKVSKFVVRGALDEERDVIYVLIPRPRTHLVKTVWVNLRSDKHKTLLRNRYAVA